MNVDASVPLHAGGWRARSWVRRWASESFRVHIGVMKTAISVPDDLFAEMDAQAAALGVSRSELYATAARRYLTDVARDDLTRRIDEAVALEAAVSAGDSSGRALVAVEELASRSGDEAW
jgi:hypothetical protein